MTDPSRPKNPPEGAPLRSELADPKSPSPATADETATSGAPEPVTPGAAPAQRSRNPNLTTQAVSRRLGKRYASERRFRLICMSAVGVALLFLGTLFFTIFSKGYSGFYQNFVQLEIFFDPEVIDPEGTRDPETLGLANYGSLVRTALTNRFPEASGRSDRRALSQLVSNGASFRLQEMVEADPSIIGSTETLWVRTSDDVDMFLKGQISRDVVEENRRVTDQQIGWVDALDADGAITTRFNTGFFTSGDSREPELAGIWGAVVGSAYVMLITLLLSFPLGVATAVYLEEFAPQNRWTDLIEININNLAAVPSIVFGLLGLAVFLNVFHLPRSAPLVGALVLTLMTLPTIIIASRSALKAVPPSIREAAYGLGASPMQVMFHHTLPLALPGMLTGTIIGMSQALGETAPLLMIGMVAFIVDIPATPTDPSTVLPVQVYLWADSAERAFVEKTSAAIIVLLGFLIAMNILAVIIRKRTEQRW
ncbi:MAG: phosphate ABC transporter permease PstA [Acidobacteriota bacterium]|nr:phosphate ABC transporter permease PstA [Acidobacteriota bacterium]